MNMFNIYIIEIKNRLILILTCWTFLFFVSYVNKEILLFLAVKPNIDVTKNFYFIATDAREILSSYLNLSYFISFNLAFYIIVFHTISFLSPALYYSELYKFNLFFYVSVFIFLLSTLIFNKLTLPICWNFFLSFQNISLYCINIFLEVRVEKYLEMYFNIYYYNIVLLQLIFFYFICIDNLNNLTEFFKKTRKMTYFVLILIATFTTPPDVLSQVLLFSFFVAGYELGIIILIIKRFFFN